MSVTAKQRSLPGSKENEQQQIWCTSAISLDREKETVPAGARRISWAAVLPLCPSPRLLFLPSTSICCGWNHQGNRRSLHLSCTFGHLHIQVSQLMGRRNSVCTQKCDTELLPHGPGHPHCQEAGTLPLKQWDWKTRVRKEVGEKKQISKNNRWLSHTKYPVELGTGTVTMHRGWITLWKGV